MGQFSATEIPLKMIKSTFNFTFKALFILKILKFLSWIFGHVEKWLDQTDNVNFKVFMTLRPGKQTITIHVLANMLRRKENQAMKFEIFFLKNYMQNVVEKILPDLFLKNQNRASLSLDH